MAGSHFDAMVQHDMIAFLVLATIPFDLFIFYYLRRISLAQPHIKCNEYLFKPIYPPYYSSTPSKSSILNEDENIFSMHYGQIWSNIFNEKHSFTDYLVYFLRFFSFCCSFLSLYTSFVFWMNLLIQFFMIAMGDTNRINILALGSLYFIIEVIYWFIKRQYESLILLTFNVGDILNVRIVNLWRIYSIFVCTLCTFWAQSNSDIVGWKYFLLFMLYRGLYWCIIYISIVFITTVITVIKYIRKCKHIYHLFCVLSTKIVIVSNNNICTDPKCKLIYILFLWIFMLINIMLMAENLYLFQFCFIMIFIYYILIMFERGKYNAIYLLYRNKFNKSFFSSMTRLDTVDDFNHLAFNTPVHRFTNTNTPELQLNIQYKSKSIGKQTKSLSKSKSKSKSKGKSSTKSPKFDLIYDQSDNSDDDDDDDDDDGVNVDHISPQSNDNDDDADFDLNKQRLKQLKVNTDTALEHNDDQKQQQQHGKHSNAIEYQTFWDKVEFPDDRRCKCCTLCGKKCLTNNGFKAYCGGCCCSFDGLKWSLTLILFILFIFGTTGIAHRYLIFDEKSYDTDLNRDINSNYPVCDLKYNQYLTSIDLVYLSITSYHQSEELINKDFEIWFGNNDTHHQWDMHKIFINNEAPIFYHIYNNEYLIDIVSIRGDPDPSGLLQDIALWSESAMFQIFSWIIPLTNILPKAFIREFISYLSMFEGIIAPHIRETFDIPVYNYIKNNIVQNNNDSILLLVGHSLGGGIAQIVGAKLYDNQFINDNIISFGISTPGLVYSSAKFGFNVESLDKSSISIIPRRDVIGMIDEHGGFKQNIECSAEYMKDCHSSVNTFCELYDQCNNNLIRNMTFVKCVCHQKREWDDCY